MCTCAYVSSDSKAIGEWEASRQDKTRQDDVKAGKGRSVCRSIDNAQPSASGSDSE